MPQRLGIITKYFAFNIGAFLQAHAMVQVLRGLGHEAELVEHMHTALPGRMLFSQLRARGLPQFAFKVRQWREFVRARALLPVSAPFHTGLHYDAVVIGSDELWHLDNPTIGYNPLYFGHGAPAPRTISYASSFGSTTWSPRFPPGVAEGLRNFTALSARDDNTHDIIERLTGRDVPVVLDPTCLYDYPTEAIPCPEQGYYLVYGALRPDDMALLRARARGERKRLISIGVYNPGCDANLVVSPFAWLGYCRGADAIITSMYHGTIFALKHAKPFAVIMRQPMRANKINALAARVGIADRVLTDATRLSEVLDTPPDGALWAARLDELKTTSLDYLRHALA